MIRKVTTLAAFLVAAPALAALLVNGAGATFPFPLYSKWFSAYNKLNPEMQFNYQSIGSGGGIQQITAGTVDFGASDAPMSDAELLKAPDLLHIPTAMGAVVVTWNLPSVKALKLTPDVLADVFLGQVTKWNDARIAKENPGVTLPDQSIAVVHRSDGSGTTAIFTDYLAKVSPAWKTAVGAGKSVKWPAGLGAKGNEGVTGQIKQIPGAIGYVELVYAQENKLPSAALKNRAGKFVEPTIASTSAAAVGAQIPADMRVSLTDAPGAEAYPIASLTYLLVHKNQTDAAKGKALVEFLWWAIHDGQKLAAPLYYAPLPAPVVTRDEALVKSITVEGKPVSLGRG